MTQIIQSKTVKSYRKRKNWTQLKLAEMTGGPNKVSLPTIKRIESAKNGVSSVHDRVAEALAKALGIKVEDLTKAPPSEEALQKLGLRPLRVMISEETLLAIRMTEHIYGIPLRAQVEMAPLFAALLAESSLAWRQKRIAALETVVEQRRLLGDIRGGHLSFALAGSPEVEDGIRVEQESIAKRDIFGKHVSDESYEFGYDPNERNPFVDYLADFARETGSKMIAFGGAEGGPLLNECDLPSYQIGVEIVAELTDGNEEAKYALLSGHVRVKDIPENLLGADQREKRAAWMIARIPDDERAKRREAEKAKADFLNLNIKSS